MNSRGWLAMKRPPTYHRKRTPYNIGLQSINQNGQSRNEKATWVKNMTVLVAVLALSALSFAPESTGCSGTSGSTCCRVGQTCSSPGESGCCQGPELCGAGKTCYCAEAKTCLTCTNLGNACTADANCCDERSCGAGKCCVGKGQDGCRVDVDCCSGLTCKRHYNVFTCQ